MTLSDGANQQSPIPHFGDLIDQLFRSKIRSTDAVATLSGVSKQTINTWRQGRTRQPRNVDSLLLVAEALHCTLDEVDSLLRAAGHLTVTDQIQELVYLIKDIFAISQSAASDLLLRCAQDELSALDMLKKKTTKEVQTRFYLVKQWIYRHFQKSPLKENDRPSRVLFQAPQQSDFYIDRSTILQEVETHFFKQGHNVASLFGMGGVGKTALAIELAHQLRDHFSDGVLWVSLSQWKPSGLDQGDNDELTRSILISLIRDLYPGGEEDIEKNYERLSIKLQELLASQQVLLIIDNVDDPQAIQWLRLPQSGKSKICITSRLKTLPLSGCRYWMVPPFSAQECAFLFSNQMDADRFDLDGINQLVGTLGGLPVALKIVLQEMVLTPDISLRDYLDHFSAEGDLLVSDWSRPDQGVRHVFERSFQMLQAKAPADFIFAALSLFGGHSFTAEAVAATTQIPLFESKRILARFLEMSLIERWGSQDLQNAARYKIHPLLKVFAQEKLADFDQKSATLAGRLGEYYTQFTQENERLNKEVIDIEWGNISETFSLVFQAGDTSRAVNLLDQLTHIDLGSFGYLDSRGKWSWATEIISTLLAIPTNLSTLQSAVLSLKLSAFYARQGLYSNGLEQMEKALVVFSDQQNRIAQATLYHAYILDVWAYIDEKNKNMSDALEHSKKALNLFDSIDDLENTSAERGYFEIRYGRYLARNQKFDLGMMHIKSGMSVLPSRSTVARQAGLISLGAIHYLLDEFDPAEKYWQLGVNQAKEDGNLWLSLSFQQNLVLLQSEKGNFVESEKVSHELILGYSKINELHNMAQTRSNLADDYILAGKLDLARSNLDKCLVLLDELSSEHTRNRLMVNLNYAFLEWRKGKYRQANDWLEKIPAESENQEFRTELKYMNALISATTQTAEESLSKLKAFELNSQNDIFELRLARLRANLLNKAGDAYGAIEILQSLIDLLTKRGANYDLAITQNQLGRSFYKIGDESVAETLSEQAEKYFKAQDILKPMPY